MHMSSSCKVMGSSAKIFSSLDKKTQKIIFEYSSRVMTENGAVEPLKKRSAFVADPFVTLAVA